MSEQLEGQNEQQQISQEQIDAAMEMNKKEARAVRNIFGTLSNLQVIEQEIRQEGNSALVVPGRLEKLKRAQMQLARAIDEMGVVMHKLQSEGKNEEVITLVCANAYQNGLAYFQAILYSLHIQRISAKGTGQPHQRVLHEAYGLLDRLQG